MPFADPVVGSRAIPGWSQLRASIRFIYAGASPQSTWDGYWRGNGPERPVPDRRRDQLGDPDVADLGGASVGEEQVAGPNRFR